MTLEQERQLSKVLDATVKPELDRLRNRVRELEAENELLRLRNKELLLAITEKRN